MFKFFKRKNPEVNIRSISVPTFGWETVEQNDERIVWVNPEQSALISLYFFNIPPNLPTVKNVEELRNFYRQSVAESGGGLVEVSVFKLHGIPSVKTIFKMPQPERGMTYLASVTIPFENCSFVIKAQAVEVGTTGIRDNLVLSQFLQTGEVTFDDDGLKNWFEDPYDASFREGALMNKSEREEYDNEFPDHPLSVVRHLIHKALKEMVLNDDIKHLPAFDK